MEPFTFYMDNQLTGYDIELMQRFACWCNAKLVVEVHDWNGLIPACASGGKGGLRQSNLFETPERREAMDSLRAVHWSLRRSCHPQHRRGLGVGLL